jgi:hypothetical protein
MSIELETTIDLGGSAEELLFSKAVELFEFPGYKG